MKMLKFLKNRVTFILTILANIIAIAMVFILMQYVQALLNRDIEINLKEIVIQNKVVINAKLQLELNNINIASKLMAKDFESYGEYDEENYREILKNYCDNEQLTDMFIADTRGNAYFLDGSKLNIEFRKYYINALEGKNNIDKIYSRLAADKNKQLFVMSVPLSNDGVIRGTVNQFYSVEEMYRICELSLFSSKGFMHIINKKGEIVVQSQNFNYNKGDDKFFRILTYNDNAESSNQLESDIAAGRENYMKVKFGKNEFYCAYTPIEGLYDWCLISSISVDEVSANSKTVVMLFYIILLSLVVFSGVSLVLFFLYKQRQQKNRDKITFVDSVTGGRSYAKFLLDYRQYYQDKPLTSPLYLLSFDIDNFKYINSYYGFEYGDNVLKQIYEFASLQLSKDEMVARISGDKFIALINDASEERIKALLNVPFAKDRPVYFTAGVYGINDVDESIHLMIDKADTAAQSVKSQFHNKIAYYSAEYDAGILKNEQLKREIDAALAGGEIVPFYQPKVNVSTNRLTGAEALARWLRADGKIMPPIEFIPLCEKTGQILQVDMAIFEQVLKFIAKNLEQGVECMPISVNFSRMHLKNPEFLHKIIDLMDSYGVPGKYIEIELTESIIFEETDAMKDFVRHLHEHDLLLCIDDFGSGYSSLNMLKDIPVDVLKIDKGFLDETENRERQMQILSVITQMAQKLGMSVVVEGVETKENVEIMKQIGCFIAQGYYYARPMNEENFKEKYKKGTL